MTARLYHSGRSGTSFSSATSQYRFSLQSSASMKRWEKRRFCATVVYTVTVGRSRLASLG